MTKILVADDNSNIQKMVGLALKDQGIEVVGVGNGEAAVRKATEIHPDLVLADVFMPVRNGYEVCSFIKGDASLAHIPVILLVGAFDPLDEQEAQRVGADGVLKKPFVPPDPLISMVKSALARAAAAPPPVPAAKQAPPPEPDHTVRDLPEAYAPPPQPQQVHIPEGSQAMAFGSLLDTTEDTPALAPAAHDEDNSDLLTRNPHLENQRSWGSAAQASQKSEAPADEQAEAESVAHTGWVSEEEASPSHNEPSGGSSYGTSGLEINTFQNQAPVPQATPPAAPPTDPSSFELETENEFALQAEATNSSYGTPHEELGAAYEFMAPPSPEIAAAVNASALGSEFPAVEEPAAQNHPEEHAAGWATEPPPNNTWDLPAPATQEEAWNLEESTPAAAPEADQPLTPVNDPLSFSQPAPSAPVPEPSSAQASPPAAAPTTEAGLDSDATVNRILEKMSPEMLQTVTRELLKPVIQALVQEELDKKK